MTYEEALAAMRQAFAADVLAGHRRCRLRLMPPTTVNGEQEAFDFPPRDLPRLLALEAYCRAFHHHASADTAFAELVLPLPFMASHAYRVLKRHLGRKLDLATIHPSLEAYRTLGELLGVPRALATSWPVRHYRDFPRPRPRPRPGADDGDIPF